jgi:AbrB family looped-hinge helix DNA binding protein
MVKLAKVTRAGQISLPADIRRRWDVERVMLDDRGDHLVVRPLPDDPVRAVRGLFKGRIGTAEDLRAAARRDEAAAEARRHRP